MTTTWRPTPYLRWRVHMEYRDGNTVSIPQLEQKWEEIEPNWGGSISEEWRPIETVRE